MATISLSATTSTTHHPSSSILVSGYEDAHSGQSGLIGLDPTSGSELWRRPLFARPTAHDCGLVAAGERDAGHGRDCVVVGERGLMAAVRPKDGEKKFIIV